MQVFTKLLFLPLFWALAAAKHHHKGHKEHKEKTPTVD